MSENRQALEFLDWLDGSGEIRLDDETVDVVAALRSAGEAISRIADAPMPDVDFADGLEARLEVMSRAELSNVIPLFDRDSYPIGSKLDATARVRASHPLEVAAPGVAHRRINRSSGHGRSIRTERRWWTVSAAVVALIVAAAALAVPIAKAMAGAFSLNRAAEVVSLDRGAEILASGQWRSLKIGDKVGAGESVRTHDGRLVLRLADDSVIRFDKITYGTLEIESSDPNVTVGEGRVYVEVNSSGAIDVKVDDITIASHEPGSAYTVEKNGLVVTAEGRANVTNGSGATTNVGAGQKYVGGAVEPDPLDSQWVKWNQAGGRDPQAQIAHPSPRGAAP